ncbi:hypothetical protein ACHAW6_004652 [Cyclotella cf. meneghiniana]
MTLHDLSSPSDLTTFLTTHPHSLVCFSATWCGPCKASKPLLESLAAQYATDDTVTVSCGIVYEHVLGEDIQKYRIRAFPTYILFSGISEVGRVEGANFDVIKSLVREHCKSKFSGEGNSLGSGTGAALSPAEARARRLAKFVGGGDAAEVERQVGTDAKQDEYTADVKDEVMKDTAEEEVALKTDDGATVHEDEIEMVDPADKLSQEDIETLTNSMGFSLIRAQKGLLHGDGTLEGAVEWLMEHQEDADIDDPIEKVPKASDSVGGGLAQSYKCNECGKILSNMANLELHANKTGHSDFEESNEIKKPLTEEEKKAKIAEIKFLLKAKRIERENAEKEENVDREKQRRFMGKEMAKTREQMEAEARKRQAQLKKKEKEAAIRERQRIRAELEKDKRERAANKGKLGSKLGVDGYNPDAIQYDVPGSADGDDGSEVKKSKKAPPSAAKMDEYIKKVSSYRAGGDGGRCLKVLKAYISNVVDHPDDDKYKKINMDNTAYKTKVKPFLGAKNLLLCVGFNPNEDGTSLELSEDADVVVLKQAKEKLEVAYDKYVL